MDQLSQSFLDSCRQDAGRTMRGENMTRIEIFVDAAFAFAFTMLVISIDEIHRSPQELFLLSRDIPAFIISASVIGSIWLAHSNWSRTFGLQDSLTIYLSLGLFMLMLIFVYPIKLVIQLSVSYLSRGMLGTEPPAMLWSDMAELFVYFALGLVALSVIIICLYQNSLRHEQELVLTKYAVYYCKRMRLTWIVVALTAMLSCLAALLVNESTISVPGYVYLSLFVTIRLAGKYYERYNPLSQS
ncbi:MAG: TMEM175 family protein [Pseudohongiellaceae bacterium]